MPKSSFPAEKKKKEEIIKENFPGPPITPVPAKPAPSLPKAPMLESHVSFNPDGGITYTTGGKSFILTKEEYNNVLRSSGGAQGAPVKASPKTQEIMGFEKLPFEERLLRQEMEKLPSGAEIPTIEKMSADLREQELTERKNIEMRGLAEQNKSPAGLFTPESLAVGALGGGIALQTAAQIIDTLGQLGSLFSSKGARKATSTQQAEQTFVDANAVIEKDIELVRLGQRSDTETIRDFERAVASVNRLESDVKLKGKFNLRYWLDQGKEMETQIALEKQILENQRIKLLNAIQEARVMRAKTAAGLK